MKTLKELRELPKLDSRIIPEIGFFNKITPRKNSDLKFKIYNKKEPIKSENDKKLKTSSKENLEASDHKNLEETNNNISSKITKEKTEVLFSRSEEVPENKKSIDSSLKHKNVTHSAHKHNICTIKLSDAKSSSNPESGSQSEHDSNKSKISSSKSVFSSSTSEKDGSNKIHKVVKLHINNDSTVFPESNSNKSSFSTTKNTHTRHSSVDYKSGSISDHNSSTSPDQHNRSSADDSGRRYSLDIQRKPTINKVIIKKVSSDSEINDVKVRFNEQKDLPKSIKESPHESNHSSKRASVILPLNGKVEIDKNGFLEEINMIQNAAGQDISNLVKALGGDFDFDSDSE